LRYGAAVGVVIAAALTALLVLCVLRVQGLWRTEFPQGLETIGDVARFLSPVAVDMRGNGPREVEVLGEVRRIVAMQMGLPLEKVLPETEFVRDLGF
jgi:hypothetical protein